MYAGALSLRAGSGLRLHLHPQVHRASYRAEAESGISRSRTTWMGTVSWERVAGWTVVESKQRNHSLERTEVTEGLCPGCIP